MDIGWDDLRLFLSVAEAGSLSGAARKLRIGQPTVTRRLAAFEHALGATLFRRSVAGAALTSAGERLIAPARKMAEFAGEAGRAAASRAQKPVGVVRVTSSPLVCFDFLAPFAALVARRYPGLRLEISSTMSYVDLHRGEADLAIRLRAPDQEDLEVVAHAEVAGAPFVSRALRDKLPRKPKLHEIPWIAWAPPFDALPPNPFLAAHIPNFEPVFSSDNILVNLAAAEAGVGAMVLGRSRHRFTRPGPLVPLPLELGPEARTGLWLVCARSALHIARVRAVADLLVAELGQLQHC
jgi:DNA-binding transcriptional LysR family regulator